MSIFDTKIINEYNPYSLLEKVISVASEIDYEEESLSRNTIDSGIAVSNDTESSNRINQKISELIQHYNNADDDMRKWVLNTIHDSPKMTLDLTSKGIDIYLNNNPKMITSIARLTVAMEILKKIDISDIENIKDLRDLYQDITKDFNQIITDTVSSFKPEKYDFSFLAEKSQVTENLLIHTLNQLKDLIVTDEYFDNPMPAISVDDYYLKYEIMEFLSRFKAILYSHHKTLVLECVDLIKEFIREGLI